MSICYHCEREVDTLYAYPVLGVSHDHPHISINESKILICERCQDRLTHCELCGHICDKNHAHVVCNMYSMQDSYIICIDCYDRRRFSTCSDCGSLHDNTCMVAIDDDHIYCPDCQGNYDTCCECSSVVDLRDCYYDDRERSMCAECYEQLYSCCDVRKRYSFNTHRHVTHYMTTTDRRLCSRGYIVRTYGLELETCGDFSCVDPADYVDSRFCYRKYDSTIDDNEDLCEELCFQPMSIAYIQSNSYILRNVCDLASRGFTSYDTGRCGIHISFSKDTVSSLTLYKMFKLLCGANYRNWYKLSRRRENQFNDWSYMGYSDYDRSARNMRGKYIGGKYHLLNLSKKYIIECRLFRGTLHYPSLIACFYFIDSWIRYSEITSIRDISFSGLISYCYSRTDYPELTMYLDKCGFRNNNERKESEVI